MAYARFVDLPKETLTEMIKNDPWVGHAIIDRKTGKFLDVNEAYCKLLGRTAAELSETAWWDITEKPDDKYDLDMVQKVIDGKVPHYVMQKNYIGNWGERIPAEIFVVPIEEEHNKVAFYVRARGMSLDSLQVFRTMVEEMTGLRELLQVSSGHHESAAAMKVKHAVGGFIVDYWKPIVGFLVALVGAFGGAIYLLTQLTQ